MLQEQAGTAANPQTALAAEPARVGRDSIDARLMMTRRCRFDGSADIHAGDVAP
jgi:hypothetical protein